MGQQVTGRKAAGGRMTERQPVGTLGEAVAPVGGAAVGGARPELGPGPRQILRGGARRLRRPAVPGGQQGQFVRRGVGMAPRGLLRTVRRCQAVPGGPVEVPGADGVGVRIQPRRIGQVRSGRIAERVGKGFHSTVLPFQSPF